MRSVPPAGVGVFDLIICSDGTQWFVVDRGNALVVDYLFPRQALAVTVARAVAKARGVRDGRLWMRAIDGRLLPLEPD